MAAVPCFMLISPLLSRWRESKVMQSLRRLPTIKLSRGHAVPQASSTHRQGVERRTFPSVGSMIAAMGVRQLSHVRL